MKFELALKLRNALYAACPVDTGQLQRSIQPTPEGTEHEWLLSVGNEYAGMNGTPSEAYAAFTNSSTHLTFKGKKYRNPNYHWANNAIKKWAQENGIQIALEIEEYEDNENE